LALKRELVRTLAETDEELEAVQALDGDIVEYEERAALQETQQRILARLEDHERAGIREIDDAIARLNAGTYGICERCGQDIGAERLEALPAARFCLPCRQALDALQDRDPKNLGEAAADVPEGPTVEPPPLPEYSELGDEELAETVRGEIAQSGIDATQRIEVECRDGKVILTGEVPVDAIRDMVVELIEDRMGLEVEEHLRAVGYPWETDRETSPTVLADDPPQLAAALGTEEVTEDVIEAEEKEIPYSPPDGPVPPPRKE
jgi:DnaK suppressor protein